jgi:hypothetical protein
MRRFRALTAGLSLLVGAAAFSGPMRDCDIALLCGGTAWAAPDEGSADQGTSQSRSGGGRQRSALHKGRHGAHHRAAHEGRHGHGHGRTAHREAPADPGDSADVTPDQDGTLDLASTEPIVTVAPEWVVGRADGLASALAVSPPPRLDLVAEWKLAVSEIAMASAVPTETLKSFNDFPPDDGEPGH